MHQFKAEQFLPIDKKEAWAFFSSPKNLSLITPPKMDFKILSKLNGEEIVEGMKIDYSVKPFMGIAVRWQTEICNVQNQNYFTDRQAKGPFQTWVHSHTFKEVEGGVLMLDVVNYKLPFGFIGTALNSILIKRKVESIFAYRKKKLESLFN